MGENKKMPGWVVGLHGAALIYVLVVLWITFAWQAALMATVAAVMGVEFGMIGARWHDDKEARHD